MNFQKRNLSPRIFFKRRPLRIGSANISDGAAPSKRKALFSFPVIIFISSLIVAPALFFVIIFGERALGKIGLGIMSKFSFLSRKTEIILPRKEEACSYRNPLDLTCLQLPWNRKKIAAVSIDNMVDGRPQSGIAEARLVIEMPVEAGITRFLAFFVEGDDVSEVGPVRSARPYLIDFAKEYKATLVHVGGSPEALKIIQDEMYPDLDEMKNGVNFWRDGKKVAPHSTFISADNIFATASRLSDVEVLPVLREAEAQPRESRLRIAAPSSSYEVQWKYNKENNRYDRFQAGSAHKDAKGQMIFANNVLVLRMPIEVIDDIGRRSINTLGEGEALIFRNGETIKGIWKKSSLGDRTRFYDGAGGEIAFLPGPMWIEIVSKTAKVEYN